MCFALWRRYEVREGERKKEEVGRKEGEREGGRGRDGDREREREE